MSKKLSDYTRPEMYKISSQFACFPHPISIFQFCRHFDLNERIFLQILKKAIIESIIPDNMVSYLAEKVSENSDILDDEDKRKLTSINLAHCIQRRQNFHFSKSDTRFYAEDYVSSPLSFSAYAKTNHIPLGLFSATLKSAIDENLVKESTIIALKLKSLSCYNKESIYS